MDYNQKLNAISRAVIILTMFGLLTNNRLKVLITGIITLGIIYLMLKSYGGFLDLLHQILGKMVL